ncbi:MULTISPECIES: hypothetical protein [unclassified Mesorhizobium]|uniref:hypothetical protein n=1 Tax=unclassified Mesorhizobium TaxID=325217 RepID=UPI0012EBB590|nr:MULTISPECIES: hypothetical protein [unclassified Mesorhizobium]WJI82001.1 hypothetical protein NLY34_04380 [Mesorhizobium sp. C374B]WJI88520.1 hypothetical protein NLY42_06790 [Mesorhizobium sp. C372A]
METGEVHILAQNPAQPSDADWRGVVRDLKVAVKLCQSHGGNRAKYCQMSKIYRVAWGAYGSNSADSLARYCAEKLGRRQRTDTSLFHYLLAITDKRPVQTISAWAKAMVLAYSRKVHPREIFSWLERKGLRKRADPSPTKPVKKPSVKLQKSSGRSSEPPDKTIAMKKASPRSPKTIFLKSRTSGRPEK